jgi:hypothetical protein
MEYNIGYSALSMFNEGIEEDFALSNNDYTSLPRPRVLSSIRTINEVKSAIRTGDETRLRVLKRGRTTGWTVGRINEFETAVKHIDGLATRELVVTNIASDHPFCAAGDSGSLVFDRFGDVVGLLHATIFPTAALLTPIEAVFEDIKTCTGATKVQLDCIN